MKFNDALSALPAPGGNGYHTQILSVANIGILQGIPPDEIAAAIRAHTRPGGRRVPDSEIVQAVRRAVMDVKPDETNRQAWRPTPPTRPSFDPVKFVQKMIREADGIKEVDVWEASSTRIDWPPEQDAVELLRRLYEPDDILFLGDRYDTQVQSVSAWVDALTSQKKPIPPHVIPNPMTGEPAPTKDGKQSFRADACVRSFKFAVAEFDGMPREDQLRFWYSVNLPISALIDSGGKSLHAWIRIDDVSTAEQWTNLVENQLFARYLVPLGCDAACRNEARLSRMPGHFRTEKKKWQRILFLCPEGRRIRA